MVQVVATNCCFPCPSLILKTLCQRLPEKLLNYKLFERQNEECLLFKTSKGIKPTSRPDLHRHLPCDPLIRGRKYEEASLGPTARKGQGHVYLTLKLMYPCEPHTVALPDAAILQYAVIWSSSAVSFWVESSLHVACWGKSSHCLPLWNSKRPQFVLGAAGDRTRQGTLGYWVSELFNDSGKGNIKRVVITGVGVA